MQSFNDDSQDAIINSLVTNSINRQKQVFNLIKLIANTIGNQVIAINGAWGSGKTFFIKQFEILLNVLNNYDESGNLLNPNLNTNNLPALKNLTTDQIIKINSAIKNKGEDYRTNFLENPTNCLYFNAWEYDDNEEPILSIIYKIINDFPYLVTSCTIEKFSAIKNTIDGAVSALTNGTIKISEYTSAESLLDAITTAEETKEKIRKVFDELLTENANKMVIVIDELDRCKPTYAIKLLEQIKHYINNENIIVVLCTNIHQLSCTIKKLYGYEFAVEEYLDKIIDVTISLPPVDAKKYAELLPMGESMQSSNWFKDVILHYINYKNLEMRSINRYMSMMKMFENHIYLSGRRVGGEFRIFEYAFLPYSIGEQIFDSHNYIEFITGNGFENFWNYISSSEYVKEIVERCIYSSLPEEKKNTKNDLKQLYDAVFVKTNNVNSVKIGNINVYGEHVKYFFELCTMLSDFTIE